jgi:3-dehydroquinate dehydratase-2
MTTFDRPSEGAEAAHAPAPNIQASTQAPGSAVARVVVLLSGPNLDLLGEREPVIYGYQHLADHVAEAVDEGKRLGLRVEHHQSNHEGALIEEVHRARRRAVGIVVNAGALSHTSWALHDALQAFEGITIELHLSNPAAREPFRHTSVLAGSVNGMISGFGGIGYRLAVNAVGRLLDIPGAAPGYVSPLPPPAADSIPRPEGWA